MDDIPEYPTSLPEYSKEDLDRAYEEALASAERLHAMLASQAEDAGYVVKAISYTKPQLDELFAKAQDDPSVYPLVASGVDFLRGLGKGLNNLEESSAKFSFTLGPMANSTAAFAGTTDTGISFFNHSLISLPFPAPPNRKSREYYSEKLKMLDLTLASTYDQVWQTYLGTSSEPHRAALFMMRTLFDNYFAWLAPDDDVRKSQFWHQKDGEKSQQIWRSERLAFALVKNIKDDNRRTMLEAEIKQILVLYDAANDAHNRGALDEDKASKTLLSMENVLKDWLDSL